MHTRRKKKSKTFQKKYETESMLFPTTSSEKNKAFELAIRRTPQLKIFSNTKVESGV